MIGESGLSSSGVTPQDKPEDYKTYDKVLDSKIPEYLKWEKNICNTALVKDMVKKKELTALRKMLCHRLELSSGGIRGCMVPGYNGINDLVVIQTAQGLIKYLEETEPEALKERGVTIGFDTRYNSKRYAELTAAIFLNQNYPVRLFSAEVITPFVPLAVTQFNCVAGVMIGASGYPKDFNGIKIYGANGCQVASPIDDKIEEFIEDNLVPNEDSWSTDILEVTPMLTDPYVEVMENYMKLVSESIPEEFKAIAAKSVVKFVFTPLHGIVSQFFKKIIENHCLIVETVSDQATPNPEFPTVKIPDPAEPKALIKAFNFADKNKIPYVIATNPDGSRMVFAEKDSDTDTWKTFNGNELGALFGWWALEQYKKTAKEPINLKKVYMIASTVSSKILRSMATVEKFNFMETLPGFKWIGNQAYDLKTKENKTIFAYEDNYGFMFNDALLDKDGIQAAVQMMTMICYFHNMDMKLGHKLDEIYSTYGFHLHIESYFDAKNCDVIESVFEQMRTYEKNQQDHTDPDKCTCKPEADKQDPRKKGCNCNPFPPSASIKKYAKSIGMGKYEIKNIRDITLGFDNNEPNRRSVLPPQPDLQMITFEFVNGLVATLRAYPKDPKLRYNVELILNPENTNLQDGTRLVNEMLHKLIHDLIDPNKNGLSRPA